MGKQPHSNDVTEQPSTLCVQPSSACGASRWQVSRVATPLTSSLVDGLPLGLELVPVVLFYQKISWLLTRGYLFLSIFAYLQNTSRPSLMMGGFKVCGIFTADVASALTKNLICLCPACFTAASRIGTMHEEWQGLLHPAFGRCRHILEGGAGQGGCRAGAGPHRQVQVCRRPAAAHGHVGACLTECVSEFPAFSRELGTCLLHLHTSFGIQRPCYARGHTYTLLSA